MPIQINNLSQVSKGSATIWARQTAAPRIGTMGTHGVLKGLFISGLVFLSTIIPIQTIVKASSVPMDTSSLKTLIGRLPAKIMAIVPVSIVLI